MGWYFMLNLYRDGDEPPARTIGNDCTHDLACKAKCFSHIDGSELGDTYRMPLDRKLIVGEVEAQPITLLAFEMWETALLTILAWMLELWKRPFLLHPPVIGKGLS